MNSNFLSYILFPSSLFNNSTAVQNASHDVTETLEKEEANENQSKEVNQAFEVKFSHCFLYRTSLLMLRMSAMRRRRMMK